MHTLTHPSRRRAHARRAPLKYQLSAILLLGATLSPAWSAEVTGVTPGNIKLTSGDSRGVSIRLSGKGLDKLSSGVVLNARRRVEKGFSVNLGRASSSTQRSLTLSAAKQPPGSASYTLRLYEGRNSLDLSARQLSISVAPGSTAPAGHPPMSGMNNCMDCHGEKNQATWNGHIQIADKMAYDLHPQAIGASIQQGLQGQVALRDDGLVCTACHNSNPSDPHINTKNYQSASKTFFCNTVVPTFIEMTPDAPGFTVVKPAGLRAFLHDWANRSCP